MNAMDSTNVDSRSNYYRGLVRWYPASWRAANEDAIVGILMDADDAAGRVKPTVSNRIALLAGAVNERFVTPEPATRASLLTLVLASVFSIVYLSLITWTPSRIVSGSLGPFSNPMILSGGLVVIALVLAIAARAKASRLVALGSVLVTVMIGILSVMLHWQGPGPHAVNIFTGLGLLAATPSLRIGEVLRLGTALGFLVVSSICVEWAVSITPTPGTLSPTATLQLAASATAVLLAIALVVPSMRAARRRALGVR